MRAMLPYARGLWPAFWTLGSNIESVPWPLCGEIDILELFGVTKGQEARTRGRAYDVRRFGRSAVSLQL